MIQPFSLNPFTDTVPPVGAAPGSLSLSPLAWAVLVFLVAALIEGIHVALAERRTRRATRPPE